MSAPAASVGTLYIVSTPIGNLGDITYRAVEILRDVSLIIAEDTRHSRTLLAHYEVRTASSAYHEHNEARESARIVRRLLQGESIALISDAGTPLLSDPGARLVRAAIDAGVVVVPVPGASALLAAVVASGIPADQFTYLGFIPRKGRERDDALHRIARSTLTTVLYESPQRVRDTLSDLVDVGCGDRDAVIARELTKKFEELRRGTIAVLLAGLAESLRGEVVLVIAGAAEQQATADQAREMAQQLLAEGTSPRSIIERLIGELGIARNVAYKLAHESPDSQAGD